MSFWPFPKSLADELRAAAQRGPVVEIGAGEGRLSRRLREIGVSPIEVDLRTMRPDPNARRVRADVHALPLTGLRGGVVLGNCVRHWRGPHRAAATEQIWQSLQTGAIVVVFEDDPSADSDAERNYRDALLHLAAVDPTRGAALDLEEFAADVRPTWGSPEAAHRTRNGERVEDPMAPLRWLRARGPDPELDRLESAVRSHGMEYGWYWSAIWRRP